MTRRPLTPAEQKLPYAGYYHNALAPVDPAVWRHLEESPVQPKDALPVQQSNQLLQPGDLPVERGWCVMPDGTGFVAGRTFMPGVTADMLDWWFCWHGLVGLRYAIWDADEHFDIHVEESDLPRRLDRSLSWKERTWGTTDHADEDVGGGRGVFAISFMSPHSFGFDMPQYSETTLTAICANIGPSGKNFKTNCFAHVARAVPGGLELRSRFWPGWNVVDGKAVRSPVTLPPEVVRGLARNLAFHCAREYHNLAVLLPKVYTENANIFDSPEDFITWSK